jgi:hypothetical protein
MPTETRHSLGVEQPVTTRRPTEATPEEDLESREVALEIVQQLSRRAERMAEISRATRWLGLAMTGVGLLALAVLAAVGAPATDWVAGGLVAAIGFGAAGGVAASDRRRRAHRRFLNELLAPDVVPGRAPLSATVPQQRGRSDIPGSRDRTGR